MDLVSAAVAACAGLAPLDRTEVQDFTALGDAVNATARLSSIAGAGEALISVATADAAEEAPRALMMAAPRCCTTGMKLSSSHF